MAQGPVIYNALIIPLSSASAPPRPQPGPPGTTPTPPTDAHPDHTLPGDLPRPEHPIYYPLPPDVPPPPYIDNTLPGDLPHPDHSLPGPQPHPEHPIVLPPDSGNWKPVYIWGGPGSLPTAPHPDHDLPPIPIPEPIPPDGETPGIDFKPIWTPSTGWIVIGIPTGEHVTPSKSKRK